MVDSSSIFLRHIDVVFFFYGLAFFSMGLAVWLESRRSSKFRIAGAMVFLAGFGMIHGLHEWMDMFDRLGKFSSLSPEQSFLFNGLRIGDLVLSFAFLVVFGIRLIYSNRVENGSERTLAWIAAGLLAAFWLASVLLTRLIYTPDADAFIRASDVLARYIIGIPGALLAAWAIVLEQRAFQARGMPDFGRALLGAAVALALYGVIGQLFVTPSFLFPANVINGELFFQLFGFPVQLFRAVMAAVMALFIIQALRAFEVESQERLEEANEARLAAQQAALATQLKATQETEQLNQELQKAINELSILYELSRSLAATIDHDTLLHQTIVQIFDTLPRIDGGMIMLREKAGRPLQIITRSGYPENDSLGQNLLACSLDNTRRLGEYVAKTGHVAWCDGANINDLGEVSHIIGSENGQNSFSVAASGHTIGVPLVVHNRVTGSLILSVNAHTHAFTRQDLALFIAIAGQLSIAIENATLYQQVQEREALRGELFHQVTAAQEQERQRIARELHDSTGQSLTALGLGLAAIGDNIEQNPALAARQVGELRTLNAQTLQEIQNLVKDLRPSLLDNLGLVSALRSQIKEFEKRTHVSTQFSVTGTQQRIDNDIEMSVFRISQEALTNIAKHAAATQVKVKLIFREAHLCLRIRDNGCGFDTDKALDSSSKSREAWGLLGMQERVALSEGSFFIKSKVQVGTIIQVCIPWQPIS